MQSASPYYKKVALGLITAVPFVLFLFLRLDGIQRDMSNSDAARWHRRSENFAQAIESFNFSETYQRYHPGVTLMWLTSIVEWGIKAYDFTYDLPFKTLENTDGYLLIDGLSKTILVIVLFVLLIVQYNYIQLLFDKSVALLFVFFVAVEPYMIGINRWYHLTSLETFLGFCAFLAFLLWSEYGNKSYIVKSGIFLGLAILTKFSSVFLLPVLGLIFLVNVLKKKQVQRYYYIKTALIFGSSVLFTIVALFPALWVSAPNVISQILGAAQNSGVGEYVSVSFAEKYPWYFYTVALVFKLSPLILVLFMLALIKVVSWKDRLSYYLVFCIVLQFTLYSFSEQKIERYLLTIFPSVLLLVSLLISRMHRVLVVCILLTSLAFAYFNYVSGHPIYSDYYSPLFGGPQKAYELGLYDDNGEYFASAARYLNTKARNTHVYVPNNVESFSYYFKGILDGQLTDLTEYAVASKDSRRTTDVSYENCTEKEKSYYNQGFEVVTVLHCK